MKVNVRDPLVLVLGVLLTGVGVLFAFDAGYTRSLQAGRGAFPVEFRSQLILFPVGLLGYWIATKLGRNRIQKLAPLFCAAVLALLVMALVPPFRYAMNGAERWVKLGPITIQPAEFAKLGAILFLAAAFANRKAWPKALKPPKDIWMKLDMVVVPKLKRLMPAVWIVLAIVLIEKEPDLGTAAVVAISSFVVMVVGGVSRKSILVGVALACVGLAFTIRAQPYRYQRLLNHSTRWSSENIDDAGYQTVQSELSMANGGLFGVGMGNGRAKHVLPAATTDFVMATVAEEFGGLGALVVLGLLAALALRLLLMAQKTDDRFSMLVLTGVATWLGFQACVNMLQANATFPPVGIPFPFVSSGGSSLIALWWALGCCEAVQAPALVKAVVKEENEDRNNRRRDWRPHLSRH